MTDIRQTLYDTVDEIYRQFPDYEQLGKKAGGAEPSPRTNLQRVSTRTPNHAARAGYRLGVDWP